MDPGEIAKAVEKLLCNRTQQFNVKLTISPDVIYQDEDGLWHVLVEHVEPIGARGQFYDVLNEVEEEFKEAHQENIMIVPVKPERKTA